MIKNAKKIINEVIDEVRASIRKVAIYVRVSTEEQAKHGFSIRAQIERLKQYCTALGWEVVAVYDDKGKSGKDIDGRPDMKRMLKDVEDGKVNTVLVYKLDRLTRSLKDLIDLVDTFNKYNCDFCSMRESIDTKTATGRMFLKIVGIFAEFERENIAERTSFGMRKKAKEGFTLIAGQSALGYNKIKGNQIIEVNEEESRLIELIFDTFLDENISLTGLARQLNIQGYRTRAGKPFCNKTLKGILTNPIYIGKVRYRGDDEELTFTVDGKHQAIISEEIYDKTQLKLEKIHAKTGTKRPKEEHYFCGTLYCGVCGERMVTHTKDKKLKDGSISSQCSYRCPNKSLGTCNAKQMSHSKVERAFLSYINEFQPLDVEENKDLLQMDLDQTDSTLYDSYKTELERLSQKQQNIMTMYTSDLIDIDEFIKLKSIVKKQIDDAQAMLVQLEEKEKGKKLYIRQEEVVADIRKNWKTLNNNEKMGFINNFIEKMVVVSEEQQGTMEGKVKIKQLSFYKKL